MGYEGPDGVVETDPELADLKHKLARMKALCEWTVRELDGIPWVGYRPAMVKHVARQLEFNVTQILGEG